MALGVFAKGIQALCDGSIDWDDSGITVKVMLSDTGYTHGNTEGDTFDFLDDVVANRVAGTTDQTLAGRAIAFGAAANKVYLDCDASVTYSAVAGGETCKGVIVYKDVGGSDATRRLLCWNQFSSTIPTNGSNIQVNFDSNGVVEITYTTD